MKVSREVLFVAASAILGCGGASPAPTATVPAAPVPAPVPARKYAIHLHRDSHVGDRTRVVVDDDKREIVVSHIAGVPPAKQDKITHSHLVGTIVVRDLGERNAPKRAEVTVSELWQTVDAGARTVLAQPGARIGITRAVNKEDALVTVDDRPAPKDVREAIDDLLTLTIGGPSDDEIFGTSEPQAVGGEWTPNVALAEKDLDSKGLVARPGGVTGKVTLAGTEQVNGTPCLVVVADLTVDGIQSIATLPPGATVQAGGVSAHMRGLFPLDESQTRAGEELDVSVRAKIRVPTTEGDVQLDVKTMDRRRAMYMPL